MFTLLSALSLLLFVAVSVLWVRSYTDDDTVTLSVPRGAWSVSSFDGGVLTVAWGRAAGNESFAASVNPAGWHAFDAWDNLWLGSTNRQALLGFRGGSVGMGVDAQRFGVVPFWFLALVLAALPARAAWWGGRVRCRSAAGLCPRCGYDLRASPDRCPECGMPARTG